MDPAAKQATRERIADLRAAGTTILLTTHELGDVERLADRVAVLDHGRLVALGTPAELTGGGAPRLHLRLSRPLADGEASDLAAVVAGVTGGRPSSRPAAARRPGPTTSRTLDRRRTRDSSRRWRPGASRRDLLAGGAADRGGEPRGAIPRAGPRRPGLGRQRRGRAMTSRSAHELRVLGAGTPARPASWPAMAVALAAHEVRLGLRRGEALLITYVIPVGVLLVFSAFGPIGAAAGEDPVNDLLPGAISLAVIGAAFVALAIATGFERQYGVIKRLGGSPAGTSVVVAAKSASVVLVELVQLVLLVGIATLVLGWSAGPDGLRTRDPGRARPRDRRVRRPRAAPRRDAPRGGDAGPREPPVPRLPRAGRHRRAARPPAGRRGKGSRACCRPRR